MRIKGEKRKKDAEECVVEVILLAGTKLNATFPLLYCIFAVADLCNFKVGVRKNGRRNFCVGSADNAKHCVTGGEIVLLNHLLRGYELISVVRSHDHWLCLISQLDCG